MPRPSSLSLLSRHGRPQRVSVGSGYGLEFTQPPHFFLGLPRAFLLHPLPSGVFANLTFVSFLRDEQKEREEEKEGHMKM